MIKYLYVLASDENDYYLEQALMSITSLKMHMPNAFVSLLIDDVTEKALVNKRRNILELVDELKVVEIESKFLTKKTRSRWLKTSMRQHISGDFLYIDCDTVICGDLSSIECFDIDLGAVFDSHLLIKDSIYKKFIQDSNKLLGFTSHLYSEKYYNSGIILCKDIPVCHSFFDEWHKLWLKGYLKKDIDQPSFNQANFNLNNIIQEMSGIWNCQIIVGGIQFLVNAKVIHYFTTSINNAFALATPSILEKIKESYIIDSKMKENLLQAKTQFCLQTQLIADDKMLEMVFYSFSLRILKFIYNWKCFQFFERLLKIFFEAKINRKHKVSRLRVV